MEYRYTAIVLKKREVGETDRLYVFYTLEKGKVTTRATGVRKSAAKLAGQLETLSLVGITVVRGRGIGRVAGAIAEQTFPSIRQDLEVLQSVLEAVAWFERIVGEDEPDKELFLLLSDFLIAVESLAHDGKSNRVPVVVKGFLFQFAAHLGYRMETKQCVVTGAKLVSGERYFFSPSAGGVVCLSGAQTDERGGEYVPMSEASVKLMRVFGENRLGQLYKVSVDVRTLAEVDRAAHAMLRWIVR